MIVSEIKKKYIYHKYNKKNISKIIVKKFLSRIIFLIRLNSTKNFYLV
jgi:hypothetical protein